MLRLPFELRAILLSPIRPLAIAQPTLRRSVFLAASVAHPIPDSSSSSPPHDSPATPTPNLFESTTTEYSVIPLSTLDHPAAASTPRSSYAALSQLVKDKRFAEADVVLNEFLASSEARRLPPHLFGRHTAHLFRHSRDSNWLDWWRLAFDVSPGVLEDGSSRAAKIKQNALLYFRDLLLDGDVDRIEQFAIVAASTGHHRSVAEYFLVHLAYYASPEASERVWESCVQAMRSRKKIFRIALTQRVRAERRNFDRRAADELLSATITADAAYLGAKRGAMIRVHADMDRLDFAVSLLPDPSPTTPPAVAPIRHQVYLILLSRCAAADRLDLFEKVYISFKSSGRVLWKAKPSPGGRSKRQRSRGVYLARAAHEADVAAKATTVPAGPPVEREVKLVDGVELKEDGGRIASAPEPDVDPQVVGRFAVLEAFRDYRIDVPPRSLPLSPSLEILSNQESPEVSPPPPTSPDPIGDRRFHDEAINEALRSALETNDVAGASRAIRLSFQSGWAPSLVSTARFISLLRSSGHPEVVEGIPRTLAAGGGHMIWLRSYWASAEMLASLRQRDYLSTLAVFVRTFQLAGVPEVVRNTVRDVLPTRVRLSTRGGRPYMRPLTLPAHTFAIAMQALVPLIVENAQNIASPSSPLPPIIDSLYSALSSPSSQPTLNILRRPALVTSSATLPLSPLDPYTFLPFLTAFAASPSHPPPTLLHVLLTMQSLGLTPAKEHWGVVIGGFARRAPVADTTFLLDALEGKAPTTVPSREVEDFLREIEVPGGRKGVLGLVAYTSVVKGLTLQGEFGTAWSVRERMEKKGMRGDEMLGKVVAMLRRLEGKRDGVGKLSARA